MNEENLKPNSTSPAAINYFSANDADVSTDSDDSVTAAAHNDVVERQKWYEEQKSKVKEQKAELKHLSDDESELLTEKKELNVSEIHKIKEARETFAALRRSAQINEVKQVSKLPAPNVAFQATKAEKPNYLTASVVPSKWEKRIEKRKFEDLIHASEDKPNSDTDTSSAEESPKKLK